MYSEHKFKLHIFVVASTNDNVIFIGYSDSWLKRIISHGCGVLWKMQYDAF